MSNKTVFQLPALASGDVTAASVRVYVGDDTEAVAADKDKSMTFTELLAFITASIPALSFRGALARRTTVQSIPNNTGTNVTFESALYDTDTAWSGGAPTRLTVPAGVSYVRLTGGILLPSAAYTATSALIVKNGGTTPDYPGFGSLRNPGASTDFARNSLTTSVIPVTPGDYFELRVVQTSGSAQDLAAASYLAMEIIE